MQPNSCTFSHVFRTFHVFGSYAATFKSETYIFATFTPFSRYFYLFLPLISATFSTGNPSFLLPLDTNLTSLLSFMFVFLLFNRVFIIYNAFLSYIPNLLCFGSYAATFKSKNPSFLLPFPPFLLLLKIKAYTYTIYGLKNRPTITIKKRK